MLFKITLLLGALRASSCLNVIEDGPSLQPAEYSFTYNVQDPKTDDLKDHHEERQGEVTKGEYSLIEPDGTKRVVKYTVDGKSGFNAVVTREGKNVKETYTYGDAGSSFDHKGSLVHDQGHQYGNTGYGQSSLAYNKADIKSSVYQSSKHSQSNSAHNQYALHNVAQLSTPAPIIYGQPQHQVANNGGSLTYFNDQGLAYKTAEVKSNYQQKYSQSSSTNNEYHQNLGVAQVTTATPIVYNQANYQEKSQKGLLTYYNNNQASHQIQLQPSVAFVRPSHNQNARNHVLQYGTSRQQNQIFGQRIQDQVIQVQKNHEQVIQQGANQQIAQLYAHQAAPQIIQNAPQDSIQQIISQDGGQTYYNLNQYNSQKINQAVQQSNLAQNENFRHPDRHDYRGKFNNKDSQAAYELRRQQSNFQATTAQPDLQQTYYDRQDELSQMAQIARPAQQVYNPQIHLANQINAYNQQQISKLYEVKPMTDDLQRSKGIILYYGKEKKFSNQIEASKSLQNQQFGNYFNLQRDQSPAYVVQQGQLYNQKNQYNANNNLNIHNVYAQQMQYTANQNQNFHNYYAQHNQNNANHNQNIQNVYLKQSQYTTNNNQNINRANAQQSHYATNQNQNIYNAYAQQSHYAANQNHNNNYINAQHNQYNSHHNGHNANNYQLNTNQNQHIHNMYRQQNQFSSNQNHMYSQRHQYNTNQNLHSTISAQYGGQFHMNHGRPLSSQQSGEGYATSYQNFSLKGAKVVLHTKHIVPHQHHCPNC